MQYLTESFEEQRITGKCTYYMKKVVWTKRKLFAHQIEGKYLKIY